MDPIRLVWPGGESGFALPIDRLRALQTETERGPEELFNRLRLGTWAPDEILAILRQGLIGAGMDVEKAGPLVAGVLATAPWAKLKLTAAAVLRHALFGPEDDRVGKPEGATEAAPENGASPASTETAP
ncbi:MAG: hypothetical protein CMH12_03355 [Maritimibacter sp.]|nr:hypothetical protein [Maritimibacter sp.]